MDGVITVIDPNSTSLTLTKTAKEMFEGMKSGAEPATAHMEDERKEIAKELAKDAKTKYLWLILNKAMSQKIEFIMREKLNEEGLIPVGRIRDDCEILESSLGQGSLRESGTKDDMIAIVNQIEKEIAQERKQRLNRIKRETIT